MRAARPPNGFRKLPYGHLPSPPTTHPCPAHNLLPNALYFCLHVEPPSRWLASADTRQAQHRYWCWLQCWSCCSSANARVPIGVPVSGLRPLRRHKQQYRIVLSVIINAWLVYAMPYTGGDSHICFICTLLFCSAVLRVVQTKKTTKIRATTKPFPQSINIGRNSINHRIKAVSNNNITHIFQIILPVIWS